MSFINYLDQTGIQMNEKYRSGKQVVMIAYNLTHI